MKSLAIAAICSIAMYGCASSPASKTYGPYNVTGADSTCDKARDVAFRIAVEQAFGTAVMAERQVKNDVLTRDEVLSHSSGFIEDYTILNTEKNGSGCTVKLTATVKPSMVNQYIFNNPTDSKDLNGNKVSTQVNTYLDGKGRSDKVINGFFTDYVKRAYKLEQYPIEYVKDNRETYMVVKYNITMNSDFLKALNYTLSKLEEKCEVTVANQLVGGCSREPKFNVKYVPDRSIIPSMHHYFFSDMETPRLVKDKLMGECGYAFKIRVNVYDVSDNVLYSQIYLPDAGVPVYTENNGWGFELDAIMWGEDNRANIPLSKFSAKQMKRVEVSLVDNSKKINGKCQY
jgi:hypothetical protein